jgi:RNA recognition motif-containing protein
MSLFVGNIPYGAMEQEIRELFSDHGTVEDVHFVMDHRRGRFRGFGFVRMPDEEAKEAIDKLHTADFQGRPLIVSEAKQRTQPVRQTVWSSPRDESDVGYGRDKHYA